MERQDKYFLNFRVSEELMVAIDHAAQQSGWDRSKQVRAMLEACFGMGRQPYIPMPNGTTQNHLPFGKPSHVAQVRPRKLRRIN